MEKQIGRVDGKRSNSDVVRRIWRVVAIDSTSRPTVDRIKFFGESVTSTPIYDSPKSQHDNSADNRVLSLSRHTLNSGKAGSRCGRKREVAVRVSRW